MGEEGNIPYLRARQKGKEQIVNDFTVRTEHSMQKYDDLVASLP
jgi:hypothetical protein